MGVIFKQSLKGTVYSYTGTLLGFVITGLMLPNFFATSEVGLFRVIISYGTLFAQFANFGLNSVTVKLFPHFRNKEKKHFGFLGFIMLIGLTGAMLSMGLYLLIKPYLVENASEKAPLFVEYIYYVLPLILFTLLFNLFDTYYRVLYNALKGIFYKEVIQRILVLITICLFYFGFFDFQQTVFFYVLANVLPSIILLVTILRDKIFFIKPSPRLFRKGFLREFFSVSLFGFLNSFSGVLALNIDIIMISTIIDLSSTGIYTVTFFFGSLIIIPSRPMVKISSVVIADAWKNNDLKVISNIYRKSSITLSLIGMLILVGIWGNIENIFQLIRPEYEAGKYVILLIGLAFFIDLLNGMGKHIIFNSKYYRNFSAYIFGYICLLILFNFIFIPLFGIIGAAMATLIAKYFFNLAIYLHIFSKHSIEVFSYRHILIFVIAAFSYFMSKLLPPLDHYIADIIVRSIIISALYLVPAYLLNVSPDLNQNLGKIAKNLFRKS